MKNTTYETHYMKNMVLLWSTSVEKEIVALPFSFLFWAFLCLAFLLFLLGFISLATGCITLLNFATKNFDYSKMPLLCWTQPQKDHFHHSRQVNGRWPKVDDENTLIPFINSPFSLFWLVGPSVRGAEKRKWKLAVRGFEPKTTACTARERTSWAREQF